MFSFCTCIGVRAESQILMFSFCAWYYWAETSAPLRSGFKSRRKDKNLVTALYGWFHSWLSLWMTSLLKHGFEARSMVPYSWGFLNMVDTSVIKLGFDARSMVPCGWGFLNLVACSFLGVSFSSRFLFWANDFQSWYSRDNIPASRLVRPSKHSSRIWRLALDHENEISIYLWDSSIN